MMTILGTIHATSTPAAKRRETDWLCWRCGRLFEQSKPNPALMCADCRLVENPGAKLQRSRPVPSGHPDLEKPCRAWLRDFDDLDHPIHPDGTLVAPGGRLCRHSDCVEPSHIIGAAA